MNTKIARAAVATAALVAAAVPATASAAPYNFGNCVAYEAMSGAPVSEFIEYSSPAKVFEDENGNIVKIVGSRHPRNISTACGVAP